MLLEGFRQRELVSLGRGQLEFGSFVPNLQHARKSMGQRCRTYQPDLVAPLIE
jgi:hypothetical protein